MRKAAGVLVLQGPRVLDGAVDALVPEIVQLADLEEIKFETAVYDSAGDHDRWWMA